MFEFVQFAGHYQTTPFICLFFYSIMRARETCVGLFGFGVGTDNQAAHFCVVPLCVLLGPATSLQNIAFFS